MYTAIGPYNAILNVGRTPFKELRVAPHHKFAVIGVHRLRVIFEGRALGIELEDLFDEALVLARFSVVGSPLS